MFNDYFDEIETEEIENAVCYESACCGYVRTNDILESIAEYKRSEIWD